MPTEPLFKPGDRVRITGQHLWQGQTARIIAKNDIPDGFDYAIVLDANAHCTAHVAEAILTKI